MDDQRRKSVFTQGSATTTRYYLGDYEEVYKPDGTIQKIHYLSGGSMMLQQGATKSLYYGYHDYQGSLIAWTNQSGTVVERRAYDPWGRHRNPQNWTEVDYTSPSRLNNRGYTGHEHLDAFQIINMNGRVYDPLTAQFFSPDPHIQAPDNWLNYNRYAYCLNNPLKYTDPDGEWVHIVVGAVVGGVVNLAMNWNNCDGFWQYAAAFVVGAGAGAATAATGGASFWATAGVAAAGSAATMGTNSIIAQTGHNFSGMGNVDWGQVGISSAIGGVSGFAGGAAGYWAANSSMLLNGISSPVLRSAVVSPLAAGAGHIAGGTTAGLIQGQGFNEAFASSFNGLGQSMAFGAAIGVASTIGVSYANKISPWTGKPLNYNKTLQTQYDFSPDPYGDNVTMYRGTTGSEGKGGPLFMTDNPEYAATYVKNGGSVVEITISRSTYMQMQIRGHIHTYQGIHGTSSGLEYRIHPNIVPEILKLFKY